MESKKMGLPPVSGVSKFSIGTKINNSGQIAELRTESSYSLQCSLCPGRRVTRGLSLALAILLVISVILIKLSLSGEIWNEGLHYMRGPIEQLQSNINQCITVRGPGLSRCSHRIDIRCVAPSSQLTRVGCDRWSWAGSESDGERMSDCVPDFYWSGVIRHPPTRWDTVYPVLLYRQTISVQVYSNTIQARCV